MFVELIVCVCSGVIYVVIGVCVLWIGCVLFSECCVYYGNYVSYGDFVLIWLLMLLVLWC